VIRGARRDQQLRVRRHAGALARGAKQAANGDQRNTARDRGCSLDSRAARETVRCACYFCILLSLDYGQSRWIRVAGIVVAMNRELIFGLIPPIGVDRAPVLDALRNELTKVGYTVEPVHVSDKLRVFAKRFDENDYVARKNALMDAGNRMREWHKSGDAAALLAMSEIGKSRRRRGYARNILNANAYVVDSIKHPDEVLRFQSIYGPAFVGIGLYEPPESRREHIFSEARILLHDPSYGDIAALMRRDEDEGTKYGQRVRNAFELADFVLDLSARGTIEAQIWRLIRCLFGDRQVSPTLEEYGMSLAHTAQAKSGSLARQVGAAILRVDGSTAAVACNDPAKPGGGQYTVMDDEAYPRGRDVNRGQDSSDYYRHKAFTDLIERLKEAGELAARNRRVPASELFERLWNSDNEWLRRAFQNSTIDYVRAVHAEMAAIADAARAGPMLRDCVLYTTTFPCHDCAKHIVAAGLNEVVYLAPYPKSLVAELYDDSIEINASSPTKGKVQFRSFVGVGPKRYADFFLVAKGRDRKDGLGRPIRFNAARAPLTLPAYAPEPKSVIVSETTSVKEFLEKLHRRLHRSATTATTRTRSRR